MKDKKAEQLGMNPSTASGRLVKDILFNIICETGKNVCFHCGKPMDRKDFTIEHKVPWLDSDNPVGLFFDLGNIAFSHHSCNVGAARRPIRQTEHGTIAMYRRGCRCEQCAETNRQRVYRTRSMRPGKR